MRTRYGSGFKPDGIDVDLPLELVLTITGTGAATANVWFDSDPWNLSDPRDRTLNGENHTASGGVIHISPFNSPLWGETVEVVAIGSTFQKRAYQAALPLVPGAATIDLALDRLTVGCSNLVELERPTGGYLISIADLCAGLPPDGTAIHVYNMDGNGLLGTATVAGGVITGTIDTTEMEDGLYNVEVWWSNDAFADFCVTMIGLTTAA
jgi:hypothetical protein